jgi:hypothetical protein
VSASSTSVSTFNPGIDISLGYHFLSCIRVQVLVRNHLLGNCTIPTFFICTYKSSKMNLSCRFLKYTNVLNLLFINSYLIKMNLYQNFKMLRRSCNRQNILVIETSIGFTRVLKSTSYQFINNNFVKSKRFMSYVLPPLDTSRGIRIKKYEPKIPIRIPPVGSASYDTIVASLVPKKIEVDFPYEVIWKDGNFTNYEQDLIKFKEEIANLNIRQLRRKFYSVNMSIKSEEHKLLKVSAILEDKGKGYVNESYIEGVFIRSCIKRLIMLRKEQTAIMIMIFEKCKNMEDTSLNTMKKTHSNKKDKNSTPPNMAPLVKP